MTLLLILAMLFPADTLADWQQQILDRLDDETIDGLGEEGLQHYMSLLEDLEFREWEPSSSYRQEVMLRTDACLSQRDGYRNLTQQRILANKAYLGNPLRAGVRWKASYGHFRAAVNAEKDPGERWGDGAVMGFLEWQRNRDCRVIVGDYRICLGTGLILNQNFSLGKQLMQSVFFRHPARLTGHASSDEYRFLRGAAAEWRWGSLRALAFASARRMDGQIVSDTLRTLYSDGFHRTRAEVDYARQVWMWQGGGRLAWRGEWFEAGANFRTLVVDPVWYRNVLSYNRHFFRGRGLSSASVDWAAQRWGIRARGEAAFDFGGGFAAQAAFSLPLGEDWTSTLLGRWYGDRYRSFDAGGIAESGAMQGERGVMFSLDGQPFRYWTVGLWADWFRFTQPQYRIPQPSDGWDLGARASFQRQAWTLSAQYRAKIKSRTDAATDDTSDMLRYVLHSFSATAVWQLTSAWRLKGMYRSRIYSEEKADYASSWLLSGSLQWNSAPLLMEVQATYFGAPDYNARLYLSERSLRYGFLSPALQGRGVRFTAVCRLRLPASFTLEAKYALTNYDGVSRIGSGPQQIDGNFRHDLWVQLSHTL